MQVLDANYVAERLREVVADEPKAFAYDIGVSLSAVYNYMNGRIPSTEVLYRIACHTGRPMEWFLGRARTAGETAGRVAAAAA
ncbi:MAG: helix-turn-helix domain-containing protein [Candidatus Binatia bacterium]